MDRLEDYTVLLFHHVHRYKLNISNSIKKVKMVQQNRENFFSCEEELIEIISKNNIFRMKFYSMLNFIGNNQKLLMSKKICNQKRRHIRTICVYTNFKITFFSYKIISKVPFSGKLLLRKILYIC